MWVEPKPIGISNHSRRSNIFSSDEKKYLGGPKMNLMHTICVVCCWRSNFRLVIVAPLAVKINAPGTPSPFKRGRYPACYNQPLLQPAPVSPTCCVCTVVATRENISEFYSCEDVAFIMNYLPSLPQDMMTSSNWNIFRVTGHLCGEFTGSRWIEVLKLWSFLWPVPGEFPTQRPVTRSFDVFLDLRLNKRLSKQSWGWWFETQSWSLWRQCNGEGKNTGHRWTSHTKASDAELWSFLWSAHDQTDEQIIETPVIWDAMALIMTSLQWSTNTTGVWCSTLCALCGGLSRKFVGSGLPCCW